MDNIEIVTPNTDDALEMKRVQYYTWLDTYPNDEFGITREDIEYGYKNVFSKESIKKNERQYLI